MYWGSLFWDVMYIATFADNGNTVEYAASMQHFLSAFTNRLPCGICKDHAVLYLSEHPYDQLLNSAMALQYIVSFHNDVNAKSGKRFDWTVEEAVSAMRSRIETKQHSQKSQIPSNSQVAILASSFSALVLCIIALSIALWITSRKRIIHHQSD